MKINNDVNSVILEQKFKAKSAELDVISPKFKDIIKNKDKKALKKVAQDFEEIFVNMIFKTMRSSVPKSDFTKSSHELEIYQGMLDEAYCKNIAEKGSFGVADMIVKSFEPYLDKEQKPVEKVFDSKI